MANSTISNLATQFATNAAAIATAAAGSVVTSDIQVLANILKTLSLRHDLVMPVIALSPSSDAPNQLVAG